MTMNRLFYFLFCKIDNVFRQPRRRESTRLWMSRSSPNMTKPEVIFLQRLRDGLWES